MRKQRFFIVPASELEGCSSYDTGAAAAVAASTRTQRDSEPRVVVEMFAEVSMSPPRVVIEEAGRGQV